MGSAQQPVIRNCRVEGLLKLVHFANLRVTRQASAHESATAHTGGRWQKCKIKMTQTL